MVEERKKRGFFFLSFFFPPRRFFRFCNSFRFDEKRNDDDEKKKSSLPSDSRPGSKAQSKIRARRQRLLSCVVLKHRGRQRHRERVGKGVSFLFRLHRLGISSTMPAFLFFFPFEFQSKDRAHATSRPGFFGPQFVIAGITRTLSIIFFAFGNGERELVVTCW